MTREQSEPATERPTCTGDQVTGTHYPETVEKTEHQGETYWTCPECNWLLKEFKGVHVDDV